MLKKKFIITIDTEGDNLWEWDGKSPIRTENTKFLPRFQALCEQYGFKPVWLTNYEMIEDSAFREFICRVEENKTGEMGMHLHAWNTPPEYKLDKVNDANSYLIEYPAKIMEAKIKYLTEHMERVTGIRPTTHRAGRWAMNQIYFDLLVKYGYTVDCSVTPHVSWEEHVGATKGSTGSNYTDYSENPTFINSEILEVPVTIRRYKHFFTPVKFSPRKLGGSVKRMIKGENVWLRPHHSTMSQMKFLINDITESESDYLMFMLHSSEFMPGGSPNFRTEASIEDLYRQLEVLFNIIAKDFEGITLRDYAGLVSKK